MLTTTYFKEKIEAIPFQKFCMSTLNNKDCKDILGYCGVTDTGISKWYNINEIEEAHDLNYLFVKYLYPILQSKGIQFNTLLLEQGKIVFAINDYELKVCLALGITHNTVKGRLLMALKRIENIIKSEKLLELAMNSEEANFDVLD